MLASTIESAYFKKYYDNLCHFAWQILRDHSAAEDVVQDTFANYLTKKDVVYGNEIALKNFLYTSVRFNCYKTLRKDNSRRKYLDSLSPKEFAYDSAIERKIIHSELMVAVNKIMMDMAPACRMIFRLGYIDGLSNSEISEKIGVSVSTIKTQKRRGLTLLKGKLSPELLSPL